MLPESSSPTNSFAAGYGAKNTRRAAAADWDHFSDWCESNHCLPLPCKPDDVALYLRVCVEELGLKVSTVQRRLWAISEMHRRNSLPAPSDEWVVRNTIRRLRREHSTPPAGKKPLVVEDLKRMLTICPQSLVGLRDKAILLIGFASALPRAELVALDFEDLERADEGIVLRLKSGRKIGLPFGKDPLTCPVRTLSAWLDGAKIEAGPVFRGFTRNGRPRPTRLTAHIVSEIVKKYCGAIGKPESAFAAHSLRAGFAVSAAKAGASESAIQRQTGHASLVSLRKYTGDITLFRRNALSKIDL